MNAIIEFIAPLFYKLLFMSITALMVGAVIMFVRRFADKKFSPFWKYAMWLLVLAALVVPFRPSSPISLVNNSQSVQEISFWKDYEKAQSQYQAALYQAIPQEASQATEQIQQIATLSKKAEILHWQTIIFDTALPAIWFIGMLVFAVFMIISSLRLKRLIKSSAQDYETVRINNIFVECIQMLDIHRSVRLIVQSYVKTPALFGVIQPTIILPEYVNKISKDNLSNIILHELSHLRRGDGAVNSLLLAMQVVYWFNPLCWFLFKFIREDMELANDAAVLKIIGQEKQKEYSYSLLEVLREYGKPKLLPKLLCMVDSEKNMERRINMIKLGGFFKRRKWFIAVLALAIIGVTAGCLLTTRAVTGSKYSIEIDDPIIQTVDNTTADEYKYGDKEGSFTITANKIHGAYRQGDTVRIFVTTWCANYSVDESEKTVTEKSAGIVPAAITYKVTDDVNPEDGSDWAPSVFGVTWELKDFTQSKDGSYWESSIKDFCKLPDGTTIAGLADKIMKHYRDYSDLRTLKDEKLQAYLTENGLSYTESNTSYIISDEVIQELWNNKTAYIGNNSNVAALFYTLGEPDKLTWDGMELFTKEIPYGVQANYIDKSNTGFYDDAANQNALRFHALIIMNLVDNADYVSFSISKGTSGANPLTLNYTADWANKLIGGNIHNQAADLDTFKTFAENCYKLSLDYDQGTSDLSADILDKTYLGMPVKEVHQLFGEPDFSASGMAWFMYDDVGVFDPYNYQGMGIIQRIHADGKEWDVYRLIRDTIKEHSGENGTDFLTETHEIMKFSADKNGFTAEVEAVWGVYKRKGDYDVELKSSSASPIRLTFTKNASHDYELSSYEVWKKGDNWGWTASSDVMANLQGSLYTDAMYHFVGAIPSDGRYGFIMGGTAAITRVAENKTENEEFIIKYFPGATLTIEGYTDEWNDYTPQSWIIEYSDSSKNIKVGKDGLDEISIMDDMIGIYNVTEQRYDIKFEKYINE